MKETPISPPAPALAIVGRRFDFHRDTFAFANEKKWSCGVGAATGRQVAAPRVPEPDYTLHCFTLARAPRQFWRPHASCRRCSRRTTRRAGD